ncbi:MAG TPA: ACP phosphodiesterase [Flavipsychrobacter sp.]|nr:ACP phosphodiesterase [Flavipsychrobacter sp.]
MNYLGHAVLSFGNGDILTGNMIADHVKGKLALEKFPAEIKKGIELHRKIDSFTDTHPATLRAKIWFRESYGLYAGPLLDTIYDHYLANDPKLFGSESKLMQFTQQVYSQLDNNNIYFPSIFANYFPYMKQNNWLYGYRTMQGVQRSLQGLARRALHMPPIDIAYEIFVTRYYQLAQCYYEFIDDVVKFVKIELSHA